MRRAVVPLSVVVLMTAAPLFAQQSITAEDALRRADEVYGPPDVQTSVRRCDGENQEDPDVIVVCRKLEEQRKFRVGSSTDRGENRSDGIPRAEDIPGVIGPGIFTGPATASGCGLGCPPEMPPMIDLKAIPEAPAGSDADRVARGEKRVD
ncbi:hypothetical protein ACXYN8_00080 [Altererythrobacter sp. CAU 1778]